MGVTPSRYDNLAARLPIGRDAASARTRVVAMERLLERLFTLPGTRQRFGLDVILDLLPVAGDTIGALLGLYIIWEARNLGLSRWQQLRMFGNVGLDFLLGLIPIVGVVPDFLFRSNSRNLAIIRRHLDRHHPETATIDLTPL